MFLSDDNYKKATSSLKPIASTIEAEYKGVKHLGMTIDGWVVELHGSLRMGLPNKINRVLDDIQRDTFYGGKIRSWMNGNTQVFLLSIENEIVYVFAHFLNHFYKEGVGLRQICDWCRLQWNYREKINTKEIERKVRAMGLLSERKAFGAYAVEYLGMASDAIPMYSDEAKWKRKASLINDFILSMGNMGHNRRSWLMEHDSWLSRQFVVRKSFSMFRRIGDLVNHARIFPLDSLRFLPRIMWNGVKSAVRG